MNDITKDLLEALKFVMSAHGEQLDLAFAQAQDAIARAEAAPQPDADGWIPWAGGECPVGDAPYVDIRLRSGDEYFFEPVSGCDWNDDDSLSDIIAYRVVEAQP